jgi:hypothetical protein
MITTARKGGRQGPAVTQANAPSLLALLKSFFLNRGDKVCFGAPWGSPCPCRGDHLLDGLLLAHLLGSDVTPALVEWGPTMAGHSGKERGHFVIGTYGPGLDGTTVYGTHDYDGGEPGKDHSTPLRDPLAAARAALAYCEQLSIPAYLERSGSGKGWHVWFFFGPGCQARDVRALLHSLVPGELPLKGRNAGLADATAGVGVEVFPKSDALGSDPLCVGLQVWLPFYHGGRNAGSQFYRDEGGKPTPYLPTTFERIDADRLQGLLRELADAHPQAAAALNTTEPCPAEAGPGPTDAALAEVASALAALPEEFCDNYKSWCEIGMALKDLEDGSDGERFNVWEEWSKGPEDNPCASYEAGACAKHWRTFGRRAGGGRRTVASIFGWAREAGWREQPLVEVIMPTVKTETPSNNNGQQAQAGPATVGGTSEVWPALIPLYRRVAVPPFPDDLLPAWLRDWARELARQLQVPVDLPAMLALGVASGGLAKKFIVAPRAGWTETINLYVVIAAAVGERKTAVFNATVRPVVDFETAEKARVQIEQAARVVERANLEHLLQEAQRAARHDPANQPTDTQRNAMTRAAEFAAQLAQLPDLVPPRLLAGDCTPEQLGELLMAHGGRMLVASDEGEAIAIICGRYAASPHLEVWLKGKSGGVYRVDRVGRRALCVNDPSVTLALIVQPDVLRSTGDEPVLRRRGLPQRFAMSLPDSRVGHRAVAATPMSEAAAAAYHQNMTRLWALPLGDRVLRFDPDADRAMQEFETWVEPQLAGGSEDNLWIGWLCKLAGEAARLAGIFHIANAITGGLDMSAPVGVAPVRSAIQLARGYLIPHAGASFDLMGVDQKTVDARAIADWLSSDRGRQEVHADPPGVLKQRALFRAHHRRFKTVPDMTPALELLAAHHYLRPLPSSARYAGRPLVEYLVNPAALLPETE